MLDAIRAVDRAVCDEPSQTLSVQSFGNANQTQKLTIGLLLRRSVSVSIFFIFIRLFIIIFFNTLIISNILKVFERLTLR